MNVDTKFDEMALRVWNEMCTPYGEPNPILYARRIRDELQKGAEPCEATQECEDYDYD